jgi:hypothetical protein
VAAPAAPAPEESPAPKAAAGAAIIRRRLKADGEVEIAASGVTLRGMTPVEMPEAEYEQPVEELQAEVDLWQKIVAQKNINKGLEQELEKIKASLV